MAWTFIFRTLFLRYLLYNPWFATEEYNSSCTDLNMRDSRQSQFTLRNPCSSSMFHVPHPQGALYFGSQRFPKWLHYGSSTEVPAVLCDSFCVRGVCQELLQPERGFNKNRLIRTRSFRGRTKDNSATFIYLTYSFTDLCLGKIVLILILLVSLISAPYFGFADTLLYEDILNICNINICLIILPLCWLNHNSGLNTPCNFL